MEKKPPFEDLKAREQLMRWRNKGGRHGGKKYLQQEVAELFGLAPATYCKIEAGVRRAPENVRAAIEKITNGAVVATAWNRSK